jgi:DNA replication and repair protein RecF
MLADLRLQNFRSYADESFEFSPGVNIIVGPNASGKTSLLEAILVLAKGSSYRAKDTDLIYFDKEWARLDGHLNNDSTRTIKLNKNSLPTKVLEVDARQYKRLSSKVKLPIILFEPNHLLLLSGSPENRRLYLDDLIEQTTLNYDTTRRQYTRTLAQRNALLRQPQIVSQIQIFPWNIRLSQLAGQVVKSRLQLVNQLNEITNSLYRKLANTTTDMRLIYRSKWPVEVYESELLKKLDSCLNDDRTRGFTSSGPHREDLNIMFNDHNSQDVASRGEARTAILALKIAELEIIDRLNDRPKPIILLDDVFSELDGSRRRSLTNYLVSYQTFITTTDADIILKNFTDKCQVIPLV